VAEDRRRSESGQETKANEPEEEPAGDLDLMGKAPPKTVKRKIRRVKPAFGVDDVVASLESVLGGNSVHSGASSDQGEPTIWIPSSVPGLDIVLDREERGWPGGRIVEVYGGPGSCKTGLGYAVIAEAQKLGGVGVLYPCEGNYDEWLAKECYGVDPARLVIPDEHDTVEAVFGSWTKLMRDAGKRGLIVGVIDSIANLSTKDELEDPEISRTRAQQIRALLISQAMRKIGARIPKTKTLLFCINQTREGETGPAGVKSKPKPPGGSSIKFMASVRLRLEVLQKRWKQRDGMKTVGGFDLRVTAEKNRMARPFQMSTLRLDFDNGWTDPKAKKSKKKTTRKKRTVRKL
jgi:recombination protein RecA